MNRYGVHWQRLRPVILARDGHRCHWCGGYATTVDHIRPLAEGGSMYDPANLAAACGPCNYGRGAKLGGERSAYLRRGPRSGRRVWPGAVRP